MRLAQVFWTLFGLVNYGLLLRRPGAAAKAAKVERQLRESPPLLARDAR